MSEQEDILIYDIESATNGLPDPETDRLRVFGCYSYITKKYYLLTDKEDIQRTINKHKYLVGFNIEKYDNIILKKEGIKLDYKILLDLYSIIDKRQYIIKTENGLLYEQLMSRSLKYITETLGLVDKESGKMELDYKILRKEKWTDEETKLIKEYTIRDLEVTKKLYEWLEDYFSVFKHYLNEEDNRKKQYLSISSAKFVYKLVCNELGWQEEYNKDFQDDEEGIKGGYVAYPAGDYFKGPIYYKDFRSLYPHIMMMCNLHSRVGEGEWNGAVGVNGWNGEPNWKNLIGRYDDTEMCAVAKLIKRLYAERVLFKKNKDKREYVIKIVMNTLYGILSNQYYKLLYDKTAGDDCTRIGREWIKYSRKEFSEAGYEILYTDTDSIFVRDPFNDKQRLEKKEKEIIDFIKSTVPFPQDTFEFGTECEINYMYFFKGGNEDKETDDEMDELDFINKGKGYMKKNYIYVDTKGKVVIKNLGLRKKSNSELSKKIFWDYLVPEIKQGKIKFSRQMIKNLIIKLLKENITLIAMRKDVNVFERYEKSETSMPAQISKKYGEGVHYMIPNLKCIGVGKGKSLCTIEEFKTYELTIDDIDLSNIWSELSYFIEPVKVKTLFSFGEENVA